MTERSPTDQTLIELTGRLIERRSVSPDDAGCQDILYAVLAPLGFQRVQYDFADVKNLWAVKEGNEPGPTLIFAGHTDVVPSGPTDAWTSDPFTLTVSQDVIYGRGAADMKGALAAMMLAAERFITDHPDFKGRLGFLITSDEEASSSLVIRNPKRPLKSGWSVMNRSAASIIAASAPFISAAPRP